MLDKELKDIMFHAVRALNKKQPPKKILHKKDHHCGHMKPLKHGRQPPNYNASPCLT